MPCRRRSVDPEVGCGGELNVEVHLDAIVAEALLAQFAKLRVEQRRRAADRSETMNRYVQPRS